MPLPILLVCGCRKYEEYLHAAIRRATRPEWETIGIVGVGACGVGPTFDAHTRILSLPVPDTYEALPTKIHAAITWIAAMRPGNPGIFKTDDDIVFDMDALVRGVVANMEKPYWGIKAVSCRAAPITSGRIASRFDDKSLRPAHQTADYCIGLGYWISATVMSHILAARADYDSSVLEDVCTGFVMNRAGWKPTRIRIPAEEHPRTPQLLALK